jgi:hypothetical protein
MAKQVTITEADAEAVLKNTSVALSLVSRMGGSQSYFTKLEDGNLLRMRISVCTTEDWERMGVMGFERTKEAT